MERAGTPAAYHRQFTYFLFLIVYPAAVVAARTRDMATRGIAVAINRVLSAAVVAGYKVAHVGKVVLLLAEGAVRVDTDGAVLV